MEKTIKNLKEAFAGESQANRRYLAYAAKAEKEGYPQVARLFRAVAEAETIHALNHLKVLKEVKATAENLKQAISGENFEVHHMYPGMVADAQQEGNKEAQRTFHFAYEVEKVHARLFKQALDNLGKQELTEVYICPTCGYTVEGEPPDTCPVCNALKKFFRRID